MKRRTVLIGLGATTVGGAVVGSGAFSSVEAERDITVNVAGDENAFLRIAPLDGPNGNYATTEGGTLTIDLSDDNDEVQGDGLNQNAVTTIRNVFEIGNQGTQPVGVQITDSILVPEDGVAIGIFPEGEDPSGPIELEPGEGQQVFSIVAAADESINGGSDLPEEEFEIIADAEVVE